MLPIGAQKDRLPSLTMLVTNELGFVPQPNLRDYTVTLTTTLNTEQDVLTRTSYITVTSGGCVSPTAGFSAAPVTGTAPLTVTLTDSSSGEISAYQ